MMRERQVTQMSNTVTVTLSPELVSELTPVAAETNESLEALVNAAVAEYVRLWEQRRLRDQLAQQYDELASMWNELEDDLAGEKWLVVENEALADTDNSPDD
jgi:predicted transcriptional regulator